MMSIRKPMALHILHDHLGLAKKILLTLIIATIIIMPEDVIDWVITALHYAFEGFEFLLEEIVQHIFHLDKIESQIYVFYLLIGFGIGLALLIVKITPFVVRSIREWIAKQWQSLQSSIIDFWNRKSVVEKILLILLYLPATLYLLSFLIM